MALPGDRAPSEPADRAAKPAVRTSSTLVNRVAMAIGRPTCYFIFKLLYRVEVEGIERVPRSGPLIIIANHQSYFDSILVGLLARHRPFRAIARSGLFRFKPFAWLLSAYGAIPIEQGKGDMAAIRLAIDEINRGRALVIHPEGGRTRTGQTQPFQRGFHLVLKKTNATILPVSIEGAYDIWPAGERWPRSYGRIAVRAHDPIPPEQVNEIPPQELIGQLRRQIEEGRLELRAHIQARSRGRYPIRDAGERGYWA